MQWDAIRTLRGTCHCTRFVWITRLKIASGIRRTRYLRLCNRSGDPKSTTPGSSANNLVIVSLLTLRNLAASATVKNCSSILSDCSFSTHCRDSRLGQSPNYYWIRAVLAECPRMYGIRAFVRLLPLLRISHQICESCVLGGGGHKIWQEQLRHHKTKQ